jgi:YesN/AraC family two-component response regulator
MYSILVVDDEYYICEGIRTKIENLHLPDIGEVRTCLSGEEALMICQYYRPQIVLTDIKMGNINGIDMIRELGKKLYPVQFLIISGYDDFSYVKGAFQSGAIDYLLKPVLTADLKRVLENACSNLIQLPLHKNVHRGDLFRLSHHSLTLLYSLSQYESASQELCSDLDAFGIDEKCCVALVAFETPQPRSEMERRINELYDCFGHEDKFLCNAVSEQKLCLLADSFLDKVLSERLREFIRKPSFCGPYMAVASLSRISIRSEIPLLLHEAEKQLCNRLTQGYGKLFTIVDLHAKKQGMQPKIKHLMSQFIQAPSLIVSEAKRLEFYKELHSMLLVDLYNFYYYFNEILNLELASNDLPESSIRLLSFFDFCNYEEFEIFLYRRLSEYAKQVSSHPKMADVTYAVRKYIDDHFTENLTLSDLADRFFVSYTYLSKTFHKTFRMPFQKYVYMLRMEYAITLLHQSELSIEKISMQVGYESLFNFSRAFKAYYGTAPSYFRKNSEINCLSG